MQKEDQITIIGAGNGGRAFAAYLARQGHKVNLCFRTLKHIRKIKESRTIRAYGAVSGIFELNLVTSKWEKALENSWLVLVVLPAQFHDAAISKIAPHLHDGQVLMLNPGRTWGAINAVNIIESINPDVNVYVGETQTLLFTCRNESDEGVHILRVKDRVDYCFYPESCNENTTNIISQIFPQLQAVYDIRLTSLNNIGAVVHPATAVLNAGSISRGVDFLFYRHGTTPEISRVIEKIDAERCKIMEAMGLPAKTFLEWASETYGVDATSIQDAFQKIQTYAKIQAPEALESRYLTEDVPTGLVPLSSLGAYFGIPTPYIDSIIQISSCLLDKSFMGIGRTIENVRLPEDVLKRTGIDSFGLDRPPEGMEY